MYTIITSRQNAIDENGVKIVVSTYTVYDSVKRKTLSVFNTYDEARMYMLSINKR